MAEKHSQRETELKNNEKYIKMVIDRDLKDREEDKMKAKQAQELRLKVKDFQLVQMGRAEPPKSQTQPLLIARARGMSLEELRLNKQLLKEISIKKKH